MPQTLAAQIQLRPDAEQAAALETTLRQANATADVLSSMAWEHQAFRRYDLHRLAYHQVRESSGLTAQVVVRLIAKVCDAYRLDRKVEREFRPLGAVAYDARVLRYLPDASTVSIWTVAGRLRIPFVCGAHQRKLLGFQRGESDLVHRDGKWFLYATVAVPEAAPNGATEVLGVDLGIVNIASDSDGRHYSGARLNGLRHRHRQLRGKLQKKGTKSAKRLLKMRRRKESRFARHENHCIAKRIVAEAERTGRGIALEELKGIRERVRARRPQRATLHSWAFAQLGGSSKECPDCGHTARANRPNQAQFRCRECGLAGPADTIAAKNIRVRGRAVVMRPHAGAPGRPALAARRAAETALPAEDPASCLL
jgi:putative transposase